MDPRTVAGIAILALLLAFLGSSLWSVTHDFRRRWQRRRRAAQRRWERLEQADEEEQLIHHP